MICQILAFPLFGPQTATMLFDLTAHFVNWPQKWPIFGDFRFFERFLEIFF